MSLDWLREQLEPNTSTQLWTTCLWAPKARITSCLFIGSRSATNGTRIMPSSHHKRREQCTPTSLHVLEATNPFSLSLSKLFHHRQLIIVLYLTRNHGFRYCTYGTPLGKSSMDHWAQPRHIRIVKTWCKPITHVHFSPKMTQGVALRPRLVRVLLLFVVKTLGVWFGREEWVPRPW